MFKSSVRVMPVIAACVAVAAGFSQAAAKTGDYSAPPAMPLGITVQASQPAGRGGPPGGAGPQIYANETGKTLYTTKDAACVAACLEKWVPAAVPKGAQPMGAWTAVAQSDGTQQWAYQGRPLYTFKEDVGPGMARGAGAEDGKWAIVPAAVGGATNLPPGIAINEVTEAGGQVFVDSNRMTLYVLENTADGNTCSGNACAAPWIPLLAGELANPTGDFGIIERPDGSRQWDYKGHPLYRFEGDLRPGDANGLGVDGQHDVALWRQYFVPAVAKKQMVPGRGKVWANADGKTLYRRDSYRYTPGGHSILRINTGVPAAGYMIGTKFCDSECRKSWTPLSASPTDLPSGYWNILPREDGTRQWAYKGYALYSYVGDKAPGDIRGNDTYDLRINEGRGQITHVAFPGELGASALHWVISGP